MGLEVPPALQLGARDGADGGVDVGVVKCCAFATQPVLGLVHLVPPTDDLVLHQAEYRVQSAPTHPTESQHSCQPTAKLRILPLCMFYLVMR